MYNIWWIHLRSNNHTQTLFGVHKNTDNFGSAAYNKSNNTSIDISNTRLAHSSYITLNLNLSLTCKFNC